MNLTGSSDVIRLRLAAAHTTNAMHWVTAAKILTVASGALGGLVRKAGASNGTSNVTIIDSPTATQHLQVNSIWTINLDTIAHTVTLEFFDGTTARTRKTAVLQPSEAVEYTMDSGKWTFYNSTGQPIGETGATGVAGANGSNGSLTVSEAEIDFGAKPVWDKEFTLSVPGLTAANKAIVSQSGNAPTDKESDDNAFDWLALNARCNTDQLIVNARAVTGPVAGKFKINYQYS